MGATQSSTQTSTDVATSVISDVVVKVITKDSITASGSNELILDCSEGVNIAATQACSADTQAITKLISTSTPEIAKILSNSLPAASCSMTCQGTDINMTNNVNINVSSINDNSLANKIKSDLTAKLEQMVTNKTEGGIGFTDSQVNAITKLKTYVETNFNTQIVNETLKNYTFTQTIKATNQKISKVNMSIAGTVLGSSMIANAIKNDSNVQSLIDAAITTTAETSGFNFSLFGGAIGALVLIAILIYVATRFNIFNIFSRGNNNNDQIQQQILQQQILQQQMLEQQMLQQQMLQPMNLQIPNM